MDTPKTLLKISEVGIRLSLSEGYLRHVATWPDAQGVHRFGTAVRIDLEVFAVWLEARSHHKTRHSKKKDEEA